MSFMIIISYSAYPGRVKKLEKKVKKLKSQLKGESEMSKILKSLV